jgi:hypothetical protein
MIDEVSDVKMKANLIVYACVWDKSICAPYNFFLKVLPFVGMIDLTTLMGISTDGASV